MSGEHFPYIVATATANTNFTRAGQHAARDFDLDDAIESLTNELPPRRQRGGGKRRKKTRKKKGGDGDGPKVGWEYIPKHDGVPEDERFDMLPNEEKYKISKIGSNIIYFNGHEDDLDFDFAVPKPFINDYFIQTFPNRQAPEPGGGRKTRRKRKRTKKRNLKKRTKRRRGKRAKQRKFKRRTRKK